MTTHAAGAAASPLAARLDASADVVRAVTAGRRSRRRRRNVAMALLVLVAFALFAVSMMVGNTFYGPGEVIRVILGEQVQGASFTVGTLRLPRGVAAVLAGACFGMAGVSFQVMLRNALASPDIIGISRGASAAAVFAIVLLGFSPAQASIVAVIGGLTTALVIYGLAYAGGMFGTRLILIGIAMAAMLDSLVAYVIVRAAQWDLQIAMRWLSGSLNSANWDQVVPVALASVVLMPLLLAQGPSLDLMRHGDDYATALGVKVGRTRLIVMVAAVGLIAFATAATGPIAFVAFLAGPIAAQMVGPGQPLMVPAALVGTVLVLASDLVGQFLFETRFPVGVVTGVMGVPYLIYLLIRLNRAGGAL